MKGIANDEASDDDDRVMMGPKAHLKRLNGLSKPERKKQRPATIVARTTKRTHDPLGH